MDKFKALQPAFFCQTLDEAGQVFKQAIMIEALFKTVKGGLMVALADDKA